MEFLKTQSKYIGEQLRTLSLSQRIAIGLLVVVLLGGIHQMMRWAGGSEWTMLLDQSFTPDQIQRVQSELAVLGIQSKVEGDRVFIQGSEGDRRRFEAVLHQKGAMPRDTSLGYSALVSESNVFESDQKARWRQNRGLETELSKSLREFPGILDADVFIETTRKRPLGRAESGARASVHVKLEQDDTLDKKRVDAIAHFVSGAVRGLAVRDVKITDGSRFYRPSDSNNRVPGDMLEMQVAQEDHYTRKIYDQLDYIQGLRVNVRAKLRDTDEHEQGVKYGKPVPKKEMEDTEETKGPGSAAGPGVRPNQGQAITDSGQGSSSERTQSTVEYDENRDTTTITTAKLAGFVEVLTASVSLPYSYIEQIYRKRKGLAADEEVKVDLTDAIVASELSRVKDQVKTLLQATQDEQVTVSAYYDLPMQTARETALAGSTDTLALVRDYGPQAGVALLALFSLFAVFRIVKKAQLSVAAAPSITDALGESSLEEEGLLSLGGGPVTVGEAEGIQSAMVGHEVDEGLVRTQQIVDQIGELVKEDPDSAATILQSWLQDDK